MEGNVWKRERGGSALLKPKYLGRKEGLNKRLWGGRWNVSGRGENSEYFSAIGIFIHK